MHRIVEKYKNYICDIGFRQFQNEVSHDVYETLGIGFASGDNEVVLVTKLVEIINDREYDGIKFFSNKIHGARSYVEFYHRDKPITKELADMVVITLAVSKHQRVFQKICFIQNKVAQNGKCKIDEEQLFLLKNFPPFSGDKGVFRYFGHKKVIFINNSQCLGSYGFFINPGEFRFISAPLLNEFNQSSQISLADVMLPEAVCNSSNFIFGNPRAWDVGNFTSNPFWLNRTIPFLENSIYSNDVYDFIRNWIQFNIGEPTYVFGNVVNPILDEFAISLLRQIGIDLHIEEPIDDRNIGKLNTNMAIFVMVLDIDDSNNKIKA